MFQGYGCVVFSFLKAKMPLSVMPDLAPPAHKDVINVFEVFFRGQLAEC